jgi:hypothetical protein
VLREIGPTGDIRQIDLSQLAAMVVRPGGTAGLSSSVGPGLRVTPVEPRGQPSTFGKNGRWLKVLESEKPRERGSTGLGRSGIVLRALVTRHECRAYNRLRREAA